MGIFDNVNWQQALPAALSAYAGASDPNSGKMLAESGWNAVKSYMQQQQMQQQKDEFQERMKLLKEEQGQREKQLNLYEKKFAVEQEERIFSDFMAGNLDALDGVPDDAGASEYYTRLNARAKEKGLGTLPYAVFQKAIDKFQFIPTKTGEMGFGIGDKGQVTIVEKVKHKGGVKWTKTDSKIHLTPEIFKEMSSNPEIALKGADTLEQEGNKPAAEAIREHANRILGERKQAEFQKGFAASITQIRHENDMLQKDIEDKFGKENPYIPDSPEGKDWVARRDNALRAKSEHVVDKLDRLDRQRRSVDKEYDKQVREEEKRGAEVFEKSMDDDERQLYILALKDLKDMGVPQEKAGQRVRALIELRRKKGRSTGAAPQGIPGDITAPGYKSPVSKAPAPPFLERGVRAGISGTAAAASAAARSVNKAVMEQPTLDWQYGVPPRKGSY